MAFCLTNYKDTAQAASTEKLVKKGNALYSDGNYDEAINTYNEAAVDDPESPYIYFNEGTALYKKEDFKTAIDAFGQAAIKSKDVLLESKSRFNLGLCYFREGEREKDSDLKKAIESYGLSVQSFQEAIELNPEFDEAAENIEMVRLMMKVLLDEIKKQEEETKKQQEQAQRATEQIQKLIEQQDALLHESQALLNDKQSADPTDTLTEKNQNIADAQGLLTKETQNLAQQLSNQQATGAAPSVAVPQPQQEHPSLKHLDDSADAQEEAVQKLSENDTQSGAYQQEKSLESLNKAIEALQSHQNQQNSPQQQQGKQQSAEHEQNQEDQNQENTNKDSQSSDDGKQDENSKENEQQAQAMQLTDDADSILDEEKENNKQRVPYSPGGFKEVDKDW